MPLHTALHATHEALGATLVDFGGWDMPLWYPSGAVREHLAVINSAGLFDIGHMAGLLLSGPDALPALQWTFTKDLTLLGQRAGYGLFLNEKGHVLDDSIVSPLSDGRWFVVLNVGKGDLIKQFIAGEAEKKGWKVTIRDLAGTYAKMDLQGPASVRVMQKVLADPAAVFEKMPYFTFKGDIDFSGSSVAFKNGTPLFLSRTGYTGEQGFEIFVPIEAALTTWNMLLEAGEPFGVIPCGLAARDSLRAGAVLPLSGQDLGAWPFARNPWPFAVPRAENGSWTKDFHGRAALEAVDRAPEISPDAPYTIPYCGFDPRKVTSADHHTHPSVLLGEEKIGDVLTCVADVSIGRVGGKEGPVMSIASPDKPEGFNPKGLVCGFIRVDRPLATGTRVRLADERRSIEVEIVSDIRPARTARKALMIG